MSTPVRIIDTHGDTGAIVTKYGQLCVGPLDYSAPMTVTMTTINTAYNLLTPLQGKSIVITAIIINTSKDVDPNLGATVQLYQSDEANSRTVVEPIVTIDLLRQETISITNLNMIVPEGVWLNSETDENDVRLTVMYYRVPVR